MKIFLIFPIHLFKDLEPLKEADIIYIIEEPLYFTKYKFHKLKKIPNDKTKKK